MPYQSISELLEAHGFVAENGYFVKYRLGKKTLGMKHFLVPKDWIGLSVEAFEKKAIEKRWIGESSQKIEELKPKDECLHRPDFQGYSIVCLNPFQVKMSNIIVCTDCKAILNGKLIP